MSSCKVVETDNGFSCVKFAGGYQCFTPSVITAVEATEIEVEGIAGVTRHQHFTRIYPRGRFCCGECCEWKVLDMESRAWAVRSPSEGCLIVPKLVCEECSDLDRFEGCRFAVLAQDDFYMCMRNDAKRLKLKVLFNKWRMAAKLRKERRDLAMKSALVFREQFESRHEGWMQVWHAFITHQ